MKECSENGARIAKDGAALMLILPAAAKLKPQMHE